MIISIFRNGVLVTRVKSDDSSELFQKKQTSDYMSLSFTLVELATLKIGDYISNVKTNQIYTLLDKPTINEQRKNNKYECKFKGVIHTFEDTKVFLQTPKTTGGFYQDYKFPLTGNAQTFLAFIVDNLNRNGGSFIAGTAKVTPTQTINFNNWSVTESLSELSDKLGFDWYLDGSTLNFNSNPATLPYTFQVGALLGLTELVRTRIESEKLVTVVYGYGSTDNLPPRTSEEGDTYDSPLLTENRLAFTGFDGESKLQNNVELYGRRESIQEFDNIKPEFTGGVTEISESDRRIFYDTSIDFDINEQLAAGIFPKITFLTGRLLGLTFNISYELSSNKVTMDYYTDESGAYPNDTIYASVGDTYKIFDIIMPEVRIETAKVVLQEATQAYLDKYSSPFDVYTAKLDKQNTESKGISLNIGEIVRIVSPAFLIDNFYEIKELRQKISNPNDYEIKFGDALPKGLIASLKLSNFATSNEIYNIENNAVTNNSVTNIIGNTTSWE